MRLLADRYPSADEVITQCDFEFPEDVLYDSETSEVLLSAEQERDFTAFLTFFGMRLPATCTFEELADAWAYLKAEFESVVRIALAERLSGDRRLDRPLMEAYRAGFARAAVRGDVPGMQKVLKTTLPENLHLFLP